MSEANRDQNFIPVALGQSSTDATVTLPFKIDSSTGRLLVDTASGSGTVTSVSVVTANGVSGSVATPTTTPAITITLGAITPTSVNGLTITTTTGTFTLASGKTLTILKTMSLTAADDTGVYTLPTGTKTLVATDVTTLSSLVSIGTITTGVWNATDIPVSAGGTGLSTITALSIWVANSANVITEVTPGAGNSIRVNGAGNAWEAFTPSASVPTTITVANEATDTTCFLAFFTAATGDLGPKTNASLTFNSNTGVLTLVAPVLGTPTSVTLTNATGLPVGTGITGFGTGVATALGINVGSAGAFVTFNGALGTPSSGTVTNLTGTASININGTVGATTPTTGVFTTLVADSTTSLLLGTAGSAVGNIGFRNATSGTITLAPVTGALGTVTLTLPAVTDTIAGIAATQTFTNKTLTAPVINAGTLSGIFTLSESTSIDLDPAQADQTWTGITRTGTAGATLAFGQLVYLAAADSRWELADADAATTSDRMMGMVVLAAAADGDSTRILLMGNIRADSQFPAMTIGSALYVGETAGAIQVAIPTGADNIIRRVGYALTADELYFNPSMDSQITVA